MPRTQLLPYLQLFLKNPIAIAWRGHALAADLAARIPSQWITAWDTSDPLPHAVRRIWTASLPAASVFVDRLCQQTTDLGLVTSATISRVYGLLYLFHQANSTDPASWLGGLPADEADLSGFEQRFGVPLPRSYREFCAVHNGFTQDGWSSLGLRPVDDIYPIEGSQTSEDACARRSLPALLAFAGDGAGNERCYDSRLPQSEGDYLTVDWDHETGVVSRPLPFWNYVADWVQREMTGEDKS